MRPSWRAAAAIDSLFASVSRQTRQKSTLCQRCQERLKSGLPKARRSFRHENPTTLSRRGYAIAARNKEQVTEGYEEAANWEDIEWIGSREWVDLREAKPVTHESYVHGTYMSYM